MRVGKALLLVLGFVQPLVAGEKEWKPAGSIDGVSTHIYSLVFGPGSTLVAGDSNGVRVWDVSTRQEHRFYQRPIKNASAILGITYAPDDTWVSFRGLEEYHLAFGRYLKEGRPTDWGVGNRAAEIRPFAIASDGETYALKSRSKTIENAVDVVIHSLAPKPDKLPFKVQATCRGHEAKIECAAFSPDGKLLATGSADKTIRLWNPATGDQIAVLNEHSDAVSAIEFSPDNSVLASAGKDTTIRLWDVSAQKPIATLSAESAVRCLTFSRDGTLLATGDDTGGLRVWNVRNGRLNTALTDVDGSIFAVAFSRDGKLIASGGQGKTIKLWSRVE